MSDHDAEDGKTQSAEPPARVKRTSQTTPLRGGWLTAPLLDPATAARVAATLPEAVAEALLALAAARDASLHERAHRLDALRLAARAYAAEQGSQPSHDGLHVAHQRDLGFHALRFHLIKECSQCY